MTKPDELIAELCPNLPAERTGGVEYKTLRESTL